MDVYTSIFLNINFIIFPLVICIICESYSQKLDEKINKVYLDFSLISICYLLIELVDNNSILALYTLNIPFVLAYAKKRYASGVLISLFLMIYYSTYFDINIFIFVIEYIIYYLIYFILYRKNTNKKIPMIMTLIIKCIMINIMILYSSKLDLVSDLSTIIFCTTMFFILTVITFLIFKKAEDNLLIKKNYIELQKEKDLRNSLFQITHEIKNPITVCKGYLDMFDVHNEEHSQKYIPIIKDEINRVLILLEDFLSIKKLKIEKDVMDINLLVEEVSKNFNAIFVNKKININKNIEEDEIYIDGDYNRLTQVLINLFKNSVEAIDKENGILNINTMSNKNYTKIIIEDNGKGMSKESLNKICKPFFTTKQNGTGLGLYLSNEIIKEHGGTLKYESKENCGTKVTIILPIKKDINFS